MFSDDVIRSSLEPIIVAGRPAELGAVVLVSQLTVYHNSDNLRPYREIIPPKCVSRVQQYSYYSRSWGGSWGQPQNMSKHFDY